MNEGTPPPATLQPQAPQVPQATQINLRSGRAHKARTAVRFSKGGYTAALFAAAFSGLAFALLLLMGSQLYNLAAAIGLLSYMWITWYRTDLKNLPPHLPPATIDDILDAELLAQLRNPVTPKRTWEALTGNWHEIFLTNRLLLDPAFVRDTLSDNEADMALIWQTAFKLQQAAGAPTLQSGAVTAALIMTSPKVVEDLTSQKLKIDDVWQCYDWLARLIRYQQSDKPYVGGVGRDWAFGFTPNLERYSTNVSIQVESGRSHFHFMARSGVVDAVINSFSQTGGVAIVGDTGIGKTSVVNALAQRMFEDNSVGALKDHQVVALNASTILSTAKENLEQVMLTLFSEAIRSGNMVIFLDEAQLFFKEGTGSFDMSQILLPVLQNRSLKLITAWGTTDFQRLKLSNPALAAALAPVVMQEPNEAQTYKIVEDKALTLEARTHSVVTFESIREAYRLSGQYIQDIAYPGRAINLLEQSASYAENGVISARSVQQAVEKTLGVKVGGAQVQEADTLLHLEDRIHERMINQVEAVKVVSAALRRARAGVGSSKRPIGGFLFLGPTGVGKTELARSLAATYFGDEHNMIRLDMSEYQQPSDAARLLDAGNESDSLILNIRKQPFSVVLLDEIEKAHPNILNLMLQLLDEGQLTDVAGKPASFRNSIIIVTSNAGSKDILSRIASGQGIANFERPLIDQLIQEGVFRAELVNRFDEIVLFRPLKPEELMQVARLMLGEVNKTLANQNVSVELTPAALDALVREGYDPQFGARPMRRVIQRTVEDAMATRILSGQAAPGSKVLLDLPDLQITPAKAEQPATEQPYQQPPQTPVGPAAA